MYVYVCILVYLLALHAGFIFAQQAVLYHMVHRVDFLKQHVHTQTQRHIDSHRNRDVCVKTKCDGEEEEEE